MRKDFLFGFFSVNDWEWLWGRTAAQIELRTIDQPIIVYKADKNKEKPWEGGSVNSDYANRQYLKWLEGKKKRENEHSRLDVVEQMKNAKKIDLETLLRTGEQKEVE